MLTPNDIRDSRFTVRHIRGGYDTDEVDRFLLEVTDTIRVLATLALRRKEESS